MRRVGEGGQLKEQEAGRKGDKQTEEERQEEEKENEKVRRRDVKVDLAFGRGRRLANRSRGWKK